MVWLDLLARILFSDMGLIYDKTLITSFSISSAEYEKEPSITGSWNSVPTLFKE